MKIKDVASVSHGRDYKEVASESGYPVYGSGANIIAYANEYLCEEGTTILGRKGTIDKPVYIETKFWNIDTAFGIVANDALVEKKYLFYAIKSIDWASLNPGGVKPSLTQKIVYSQQIPVPPLSEQSSIVSFLDAEFAKLDALKRNAEESLSEAKALFQSALKQLLTPQDGWEEKKLGEVGVDFYRGSGIKREEIRESGTPCVRYGEIYTTYNIGFDHCVSHTEQRLIKSPKYFGPGDILFAITGESVEDIGKCIAYVGNEQCLCGGDIVVMKHRQNPKFLAYALSTPDAIRQKGYGKVKLKVVHTSIPSLKEITIFLPPLQKQREIVGKLDKLSDLCQTLQKNQEEISRQCDDMKQALLRQVFE